MQTGITKSVLAGIIVGIGATSILLIQNGYIASLAFSCGLLFVSILQLNMFTGKCGEFILKHNLFELSIILTFNHLALFVLATLLKLTRLRDALIVSSRTVEMLNQQDSPISIFILSILCGFCLSLAVQAYKRKNLFAMILVIFVFSQCSYQHSLANSYFIYIKNIETFKDIIIILVETLGNFIGSNIFTLLAIKGDIDV